MVEVLSVCNVHRAIDEVLAASSSKISFGSDDDSIGISLRRATTMKEWSDASKLVVSSSACDNNFEDAKYFFGILLVDSTGTVIGVTTFYIAYSTWDGRTLFVDRMELPPKQMGPAAEKLLLRTMSQVAVKLSCLRFAWTHIVPSQWYSQDSNPPEILRDWLNLCMDTPAMENYASSFSDCGTMVTKEQGALSSQGLEVQAIEECLVSINQTAGRKFHLRLAGKDDVETIVRLVHGLAVYEKEPDAVNLKSEDYLRDGFSDDPLFRCLMIDHRNDDDDDNQEYYTCGMAFFYFGCKIDTGRFLYLEDLYLEDSFRKKGGGSLAMKALARIALVLKCTQFRWVALDWNTPALNLYSKIGATVEKGVMITRYCSQSLKSFATPSN